MEYFELGMGGCGEGGGTGALLPKNFWSVRQLLGISKVTKKFPLLKNYIYISIAPHPNLLLLLHHGSDFWANGQFLGTQAAQKAVIGGTQHTMVKLGGSGDMPPTKKYVSNTKCHNMGHFLSNLRPLGEGPLLSNLLRPLGEGPLPSPPWSCLCLGTLDTPISKNVHYICMSACCLHAWLKLWMCAF